MVGKRLAPSEALNPCVNRSTSMNKLNSETVRVRPYASFDAAPVSDLIRTTMSASNAADYPLDRLQPLIDYFTPEKLDEINRERVCFVAEADSVIVGTAALEEDALVTFFVAPSRQRKGIGATLLRSVEEEARRRGLSRLIVEASIAGAPFYKAMGYEPTGAIVERVAGAHIVMAKDLN
jgi:GNAT superfamily N-acetyltransferase